MYRVNVPLPTIFKKKKVYSTQDMHTFIIQKKKKILNNIKINIHACNNKGGHYIEMFLPFTNGIYSCDSAWGPKLWDFNYMSVFQ